MGQPITTLTFIAACAMVIVILPAATAQGQCNGSWKINDDGIECISDGAGGGTGSNVPFWANETSQAVVGFIALAGSIGGGTFAVMRVRKRRERLTMLLTSMESAFQNHKRAPHEGTQRLIRIRAGIRDLHKRGLVDDAQFLELDKRAGDYLVRLRLLELDQRFPALSPAVHAQIRALMADGRVTDAEADLVERQLDAAMLPAAARHDLVVTIRGWAEEDMPSSGKPGAPVAKPAPASRN